MKTQFVAGLLFSESRRQVALVCKNRPNWQKGKWNAIGGHIEPGETPEQAMQREFKEEAGIDIDGWTKFVTLTGEGFQVTFFYLVSEAVFRVKTMTDERIAVWPLVALPNKTPSNLRWLIEMALSITNDRAASFEVSEVYEEAA